MISNKLYPWARSFFRRTFQPVGPLKSSPRRRLLNLEYLESRLAPAATPLATVTATPPVLINQSSVPLSVSFQNTGSDVGFGPFVDLEMPVTGDAPPTPNDGISFNPGSATYLGQPLTSTVLTFPASGQLNHPFAKNPNGTPVVVTGKPGDQLVVFQLPFGSYGPTQPPAVINFTGSVSQYAQPGHNYPIQATGGFQFQTDSAGNPTINQATIGTTTSDPVTPELFQVTKKYNGPEDETATGPNFPQTYTVSATIAPGQTITNFSLTDTLPSSLQFVSLVSTTPAGGVTISQPSTTTPGGTLTEQFPSVTGTGSSNDVQMTFKFYVPQNDASGNPVLNLATGAPATSINKSSGTGQWNNPNPNFNQNNPQTVSSSPNDPLTMHTLTEKSLAIQKSAADVTNPTAPVPGDYVKYSLNFQVSDFFAITQALATDMISDGQDFIGTTGGMYAPTITFTQHDATPISNQPFSAPNISSSINGDGTTSVKFDISDQLQALGLNSGTNLLGAAIPINGTGGALPNPKPAGPGTTGTITFYAKIRDTYRQTPSAGAPVVQGDKLTDKVSINGTVLKYSNLTSTGNNVTDDSAANITVAKGTLTKSIYAVNGSTTIPTSLQPGDKVTYELKYNLPASSIKDFSLTDFLPIPVFQFPGNVTFNAGISGSPPPVNVATFGPDDTFHSISGIVPSVTTNTAANSAVFDYGTYNDTLNRPSIAEILLTEQVTNNPFINGLLLTNQGVSMENNSIDTAFSLNAIAQIKLSEPNVIVTKGAVSTSNPNGVFSPTTVGPVPFTKPGQSPPAFSGTITTTNLAAHPISSTLSNIEGGNLVKFSIIVENTGSSTDGAFNVNFTDTYDATKFAIPSGGTGLNLQVTNGTGTALSYTGSLFGTGGITLTDPSATQGSLAPGTNPDGTNIDNGNNIAVITYDLVTLQGVPPNPTVHPLDVIPNTATVTKYASAPGGPNFLPPGGESAKTYVTIASPVETKTLISTSIVNSPPNPNGNNQAVIGETAIYQLHITVPQGTTPNAKVYDTLAPGMAFVQMVSPADYPPNLPPNGIDPGITIGSGTTFTPTVTMPNNPGGGQNMVFDLGVVTNSNTNDQAAGFYILFKVVVLNVSSNVNNTILTNNCTFTWTNNIKPDPNNPESQSFSNSDLKVIEPKLNTTKAVTVNGSGSTGQAGDSVVYTITIQDPNSNADAFNTTFLDKLPVLADGTSLLNNVTYSVADTAGVVTASNFSLSGSSATGYTLATNNNPTGFNFAYDTARVITIKIMGNLQANVLAGVTYTNTDTIKWNSLPVTTVQPISSYNSDSTIRDGSGGKDFAGDVVDTYSDSASAPLSITSPTIAKTLISTAPAAPNLEVLNPVMIGATVNYDVTVTIPHGVTPNAFVLDTMPAGLAFVKMYSPSPTNSNPTYLSFTGTGQPTVSNPGQSIQFNLGNVTNADPVSTSVDTLTFHLQAVVLNVTGNIQGTTLANQAVLKWTPLDTQLSTPTVTSPNVTVVEPKLDTNKTVAVQSGDINHANPTQSVTYTITISQDALSNADAYAVTLNDLIPTQILNPHLISVTDTANIVNASNFTITGNTLTTTGSGFNYPYKPSLPTITLTIQGTLAVAGVHPGDKITNTDNIFWTSLGNSAKLSPYNDNAYQRSGSGTNGQLNNYNASSSASFFVNQFADVAVVKSVNNQRPLLGDQIQYTLTVTNNGPSTAENVVLTDGFPAGSLVYISSKTSQGTYNSSNDTWNIGTMESGSSVTLTIVCKVNVVGSITNTANVRSSTFDPNPNNNHSTANVLSLPRIPSKRPLIPRRR